MYRFKNRGVDLLVTPNHNLYIAKGSYYYGKKNNIKMQYPFELTIPEKYFGKDKRFKRNGKWIGNNPFGENFTIPSFSRTNYMKRNNCNRTYNYPSLTINLKNLLKFLGFYIAEGHTNLSNGNGTQITLSYNYNSQEEELLVENLIKGIGFFPKCSGKGLKRFHNTTLAHWLVENCGTLAWNKKVPSFIKNLPPEYIKIFLEYLFIGDGHKAKTSWKLTTTSKQLCDDVCELILKAGGTFSYLTRVPRLGRETFCEQTNKKIKSKHIPYEINYQFHSDFIEVDMSKFKKSKNNIEEWVDYDGEVYCVTIPNHVLYIKRHRTGCWCGNSLRWYDCGAPEDIYDKILEIIDKYEDLSEHTCMVCRK